MLISILDRTVTRYMICPDHNIRGESVEESVTTCRRNLILDQCALPAQSAPLNHRVSDRFYVPTLSLKQLLVKHIETVSSKIFRVYGLTHTWISKRGRHAGVSQSSFYF